MLKLLFILITSGNVIYQGSTAVPPDACFAKFRGDDCGMPPKAVMYYYKPGSRCEVAFWRGCLPNMNMFADEYECVRTCIFVDRAGDEDYHNKNKEEHKDEYVIATEAITDSTGNGTGTEMETATGELSTVASGNDTASSTNSPDDAKPDA